MESKQMQITRILENLDLSEKKNEALLETVADSLSKKDKKNSERPMRMLNVLQKITVGENVDREASQMIQEALQEIETKIFMKKKGVSLGFFEGIQSNLLMFKFLSEAKNLDTSSSAVVKKLYEETKSTLAKGSWFIVENGNIVLYTSGKTALIEWVNKTGISLNENRFFLRTKLLKEAQLERKADAVIASKNVLISVRELYEID